MNVKNLALATVAVGVVLNVLDFVVHGLILAGYYSRLATLFRQDMPIPLFVVGDFVAALVFVWVYDRVYASFGGGPKGGAIFGLYAGVLVNFPTWIFSHLLFNGFPYWLSWIWTIYGVIASIVVGAVAGAVYKK